MQHEIVSLARRQATLEDEALELMEAREVADTALAATERDLTIARAELEGAQQRRDAAFADIDDELQRLAAERKELLDGMPADLVALYEQIRARGRVAAAALNGSRCEACRMDLDRSALGDDLGGRGRRRRPLHRVRRHPDPFVTRRPDGRRRSGRRSRRHQRRRRVAGQSRDRPATAPWCSPRTARCSPSGRPRSASPPTTSPSTPG